MLPMRESESVNVYKSFTFICYYHSSSAPKMHFSSCFTVILPIRWYSFSSQLISERTFGVIETCSFKICQG